jgi:hypothetical protein
MLIVSGTPDNSYHARMGRLSLRASTNLLVPSTGGGRAQGEDGIHVTSHPEACAEGTWLHTDRHRSLDLHQLLHALRLCHDPHYNLTSTQVVDVRGELASSRNFWMHMGRICLRPRRHIAGPRIVPHWSALKEHLVSRQGSRVD